MTNDVSREYLNLKIIFNGGAFIACLLLCTTNVLAEPEDGTSSSVPDGDEVIMADSADEAADEVVDDASDPETDADGMMTEDAEQPYLIYRHENPENPCDRGRDTYDYEEQWYDSSQIYVNTKFCEPALWFDNYFATDRIFEEGVAGTYIQLRNDFIYDEEEGFELKIRLKASVELPGTENRLRLTFDGDEDQDLQDIAPGGGEDTSNSLGLQLDLVENARSKFSVTASLSPRIRFRYRYTYPITNEITMRWTQDLQTERGVISTRTRIDYEHLLWGSFLFRSSSEGKITDEYDGVDWLQAFVLYQRISNKTSIAYESSVDGITEPETMTLNYRLGVRYRKNFHREWLFYEIVPDYTWPVTLSQDRTLVEIDRRSKWRIMFRLEIHFGNAKKKRYENYNQVR